MGPATRSCGYLSQVDSHFTRFASRWLRASFKSGRRGVTSTQARRKWARDYPRSRYGWSEIITAFLTTRAMPIASTPPLGRTSGASLGYRASTPKGVSASGKTGRAKQPELGAFLESPYLYAESAGSRRGPEMRRGNSAQFRLGRLPPLDCLLPVCLWPRLFVTISTSPVPVPSVSAAGQNHRRHRGFRHEGISLV